MSGFKTASFLLGTDVLDSGTFTVNYPAGNYIGDFSFARGHYIQMNGKKLRQPADIGLSFAAGAVTVTNRTGGTLPAGSAGIFQFEISGDDSGLFGDLNGVKHRLLRTTKLHPVEVTLGAPITADADGVSVSQSVTVLTTPLATITGALAAGGVATFDVPRNVLAAWTNTAILTVTGKDEYGVTVVETSASSTSLTGKKAFKTVTSCSFNADVTSATIGTGDVLGLPLHLASATVGNVITELQDDAVATGGTFVVGLTKNTESTATSADVRGTYDPNAACDGAKSFRLLMAISDPSDLGNPQYGG